MTPIKITELKKQLKEYDQKELIQLIAEIYKLNTDVKEYVTAKFVGEAAVEELFEQAKKKITEEFFPHRGFAKLRLAEAKKAITHFKKLSSDKLKIIELMLHYVEVGTEFTNTYGDIDESFYYSMLSMFSKVIEECENDEEVYQMFEDRLSAVVNASDGIGWGYHDGLAEMLISVTAIYEDDEEC